MTGADHSQDCEIGTQEADQRGDLAGRADPQFEHADLRILWHGEQGERETDRRVEALWCGVRRVGSREEVGEDGLGRRLAAGSRDPDETGRKRVAPGPRERLERAERVIDEDEVPPVLRNRGLVGHDRAARPTREGLGQEPVAVRALPGQGDKQIAGVHLSRVVNHTFWGRSVAAQERPSDKLRDPCRWEHAYEPDDKRGTVIWRWS